MSRLSDVMDVVSVEVATWPDHMRSHDALATLERLRCPRHNRTPVPFTGQKLEGDFCVDMGDGVGVACSERGPEANRRAAAEILFARSMGLSLSPNDAAILRRDLEHVFPWERSCMAL